MRLIGIEAGGTKFVCVLGNDKGEIEDKLIVPTQTPLITLKKVINFIRKHQEIDPVHAIGVGAFGPIDLQLNSETYGFITSTPKVDWQNFNILATIREQFDIPIGFDTDVAAAALGEYYWGKAQNCQHFVYLTVGTGIGGGLFLNGKIHHGAMHPEMGHLLVPHDWEKDPFTGICPFHKDCLEGLASGPSIKARWQVESALLLPENHEAWDIEAAYLAYAMANYILTLSPERIILGGGVMKQTQLLAKVQVKTLETLAGYIQNHTIYDIQNTIVLAGLGQEAGNIGALALAKQALSESKQVI